MKSAISSLVALALCAVSPFVPCDAFAQASGAALEKWAALPADWKGAVVADGTATLTAEKWSHLRSPVEYADPAFSATVTIVEPAKGGRFFGQGWSAWPDSTFGDGGFEAALLLRAGEKGGYRVQLSHKYQCIALVKWPEGGYVQVVPCLVKLKEPHRLRASAQGSHITVSVDGMVKISWDDTFLPLATGAEGIAVSGGAKVTFSDVSIERAAAITRPPPGPHAANFSVRAFLGGRLFVFDGDEPVLQLHWENDPSMFAKLRPGYKPQLTFDSHWDLANQGAFKDADSKWTAPVTSGGGKTLKAEWSARSVKDRFTTRSTLTVGFDSQRGTFTYDIGSELEVLNEPFQFRYGFDFEHHTPLDPFRWQYLVAMRRSGELYHRPVGPFDPGPQYDLQTYHGLRVWFGRHGEEMKIAPAVEYEIEPDWNRDAKDGTKIVERKLNTAVCAAFYDTGVSFPQETAAPGTKIRVKYRYTGYPHDEAEKLFKQSKVYESQTLDPKQHFIFADEWPKLTFSQFVPLSETWIYGRTPFMSGHNQRPTYELVKNCGAGSGFAMKLGPASYGKANLAKCAPLATGRYVVTALVKSANVLGPGGRIEIKATQGKTKQVLTDVWHFIGNGTFDWKTTGFVFDVPEGADALNIAFGNAGTGEFFVTDAEFRKLADGEALPAGIAANPNDQPAKLPPAPAGAVADFRMLEGQGHYVLNHAGGEHLGLANLDWVSDGGHRALRFAENTTGRKDYSAGSYLGLHIFGHAQDYNYLNAYRSYEGRQTLPFAMGGGGSVVLGAERYYLHSSYYRGLMGRVVVCKRALPPVEIVALAKDETFAGEVSGDEKGMTLAAWIKADAQMVRDDRTAFADIIGYGNRAFILCLRGDAHAGPYRLVSRINVNDMISTTEPILEANRWYHVAMTAAHEDGQQRVRLFVDGREVADGLTKKYGK